jgi:hypothetical protein
MNTHEWAFPLCEILHIGGMAFSIGMVGLVDLRMLGLGLTDRTPAQLVRDTDLWIMGGLTAVLTSGLALFDSDPFHYLANDAFRVKMALLLAAILYNYTIHRLVALRVTSGVALALTGTLSLALWGSLIFSGLFIAFV